jgi:hypothetical protein
MLDEYLDPGDTFWTSLEKNPISRLSGIFQKRRGVRSALPDVQVIWRGKPIFVELKSRAGVASKAQKQIRAKLKPAGADWWLARSARAALMALCQAWCSGANGSGRASSRGKGRSPTRHSDCRKPPTTASLGARRTQRHPARRARPPGHFQEWGPKPELGPTRTSCVNTQRKRNVRHQT